MYMIKAINIGDACHKLTENDLVDKKIELLVSSLFATSQAKQDSLQLSLDIIEKQLKEIRGYCSCAI